MVELILQTIATKVNRENPELTNGPATTVKVKQR